MQLKTPLYHDILSQDLPGATDRDADELLQMIEDIQNQRQPPAQGIETRMCIHSKAVSDGQVHYYCQKSSLLNATSSSQPLDDEQHVSHPLSVLQASGHWQLSEESIGLVDLQRAFMRHFSLLAKKDRKRVKGISLRSLSKTTSQKKKAVQRTQERAQKTSEVAAVTISQDLDQETQREGLHDFTECEENLTQPSPSKDSANHYILNEETGLSPRSLRNIFYASSENFLTSTQTRDESCGDQKKLVENPELNGTSIICQETNNKFASSSGATKTKDGHCSQSKIKKCKSLPSVTSKRKYFGDHTESNDRGDGKQDSTEKKKDSESMSVKAKSRTRKKRKLPQRKQSVPQPAALPMRIRLSNRKLYQSYSKGTTTVSNKTVVDADQNCLPEEDTSTISCLTHRLGSDRSVGDNRQPVDYQEERAHEVQGVEDGFLQQEEEEEHGSLVEVESTCVENPEKKKLLFDESLSINTKVARHDVNVTLETSVRNTKDRSKCSIASSDSAQNVPDTRTSFHICELKSDKPECSASGEDKEKKNEKDISSRSDEDSASSPDQPAPLSQCGQGFFLTQERESGELLLSPDSKESESQKPEHWNLKDISLAELEKLNMEDLEHFLFRELAEEHYSESIRNEENSSGMHNWHSSKTTDGLWESVSMHRSPIEGSSVATCVAEEETLLEGEDWVQVQRKLNEPQQESPCEEICDSQIDVQNFEKSLGLEHKFPQKSLDKIKSAPFHSKRIKSNFKVPVMDCIKDLPCHFENRQSKAETSSQRDITLVPKAKDPTLTTSKHHFKSKSKRQESLMRWTEGLPLDTEKLLAGLQKSLHKDNTLQMDKIALNTIRSVDKENKEDRSVTSPPCMNILMYNSEQGEETHGKSPHSKNKIDPGNEAPSRKRTRADRTSATESNTGITVEEQKSYSKKEANRIEKIKRKPKKKKKSLDESPGHCKVTESSPATPQKKKVRDSKCEKGERDLRKEKKKRNTEQEESEKGSCGMNQRNSIRHEEYEKKNSYLSVSVEDLDFKATKHEKDSPDKVGRDLTVMISEHRCTDSDKQELAQHSGRTSKRQKVESSRLSSECSTSDQNLSITICNQIRRPINIRITLCCSPKSDGNASTDQHSVTGGGGGRDDSDEQRQSMESPKVSIPHRSPPSARKRKCFENDSS
ncbi:uncharacterized protein LOC135107184 [Scylla paramamosain]|uniref:uncharacterized protein LOC135107184 n=1 Tax=Scylla paramamosain TaxID=85552 RepID=UPI0030832E58